MPLRNRIKNGSTKNDSLKNVAEESKPFKVEVGDRKWIYSYLNIIVGVCIAVYLGSHYTSYIKLLHENDMWFSNINQVQREISFRTESGLYFSYFKQMVLAPSISEGFYQLTHDNYTEHLRTINILERFNIYQEVVLGIFYKMMPIKWQNSHEYVYVYLDFIFGLHGLYMVTIFVSAWLISGSVLTGVLSNAFYVFNRTDMTRVSRTMPLRESFSLPFIYFQIALLTYYFKKGIKPSHEKICLFFIGVTTLCFTITWQFAQFVLLLQTFTLFGFYVLEFVEPRLIKALFWTFIVNLATVCVLQFGNDMLYTSLVSSFLIAAIILMTFKGNDYVNGGAMRKFLLLILRIVFVLSLTFVLNVVTKKITKVDSDEHVYKFVSSKLGFGEALKSDFDARLYLCEGSFQHLPFGTFTRLTEGIVFPVYATATGVLLLALAFAYFQKLRGSVTILDNYPELVFHVILSVFFGAMAMTTVRMKFLWLPHMCIVGAGVFCHQEVWNTCLSTLHFEAVLKFVVRNSAPVILLAMLVMKRYPVYQEELAKLHEFHDPDTVQLMEWIKSSTPPTAAFSGSMQLMAAVKLCSDRPITNHPHYENKFLRLRTKEVYQIYAKRKPKDVHKILMRHGTSYIILENSICYSRQEYGCRLVDILDVDNGHPLGEKGKVQRFCHAIKNGGRDFTKYFRKVFENRTFYLYQVL